VHFVWLIYVGFLFMPLLASNPDRSWFWPTVISIPVFLSLYVSVIFKFRRSTPPGAAAMPEMLIMALMGFLLTPINENANTYVIYCVAVAPFVLTEFRRLALFVVVLLSVYALELAWFGFKGLLFGITSVVALATAASNYMMLQNRLKNLALQASGEEVHRLARLAERERISRDLHDLLGHTLSLIAIKSELAAKLMDRDRATAGREVTEVMNIAREALRQVRTAVTGIRSAALEGEIASARAMLETSGVMLTYERDGTVLPPEVETTLAMIVREAVTNIQRHARAGFASIHVLLDEGSEKAVLLRVSDDGRGGITAPGNGLAGIRERVQALGGTLEIDSPRGKGTLLRVRVPMTGAVTAGTAVSGRVAEAMGLGAAESLAVSAGASGWSVSEAGQVVRPAEREGAGVSVAALAGASGPSEMSGVAELIESSVSPADARGGVGT
jgi:two-component system sensor histidine kinase DesK